MQNKREYLGEYLKNKKRYSPNLALNSLLIAYSFIEHLVGLEVSK